MYEIDAYKNMEKFLNMWEYLYGTRPTLYNFMNKNNEEHLFSTHYFKTNLGERLVRISFGKDRGKYYISINYRFPYTYDIETQQIFRIKCYKDNGVKILRTIIEPTEIYLALKELNQIMQKEVLNKTNNSTQLTQLIAGGF